MFNIYLLGELMLSGNMTFEKYEKVTLIFWNKKKFRFVLVELL